MRRPCWMAWHGGSSYAVPGPDDWERFPSFAAARQMFLDRRHNRVYPATPCVGDDSEAWICFSEPKQDGRDYPDLVLSFGPRGGLKEERA